MSDIRRWLDWIPSEIFGGTQELTKPPKLTKPTPESEGAGPEGGFVSFVSSPRAESQIFQHNPGAEEFRCPHCGDLGSWTTWIGLAKHLGQECKVWNPPGWGASA
jgi:hypothetical protein